MKMNEAHIRTARSTASPLTDPVMIAALRHDMLRFARLQLRDQAMAEDAVQEAIEAALIGFARYAGDATLKTWVFGILRNKIVDILRRGQKTVSLSSVLAEDGDGDPDAALDALFRTNGHWQPSARPTDWAAPEQALENKQFWAIFEACLEHLPEHIARVFMMREMLGFDTAEICAEVGITTTNCHVILHRARTNLRICLQANWFAQGGCRTC